MDNCEWKYVPHHSDYEVSSDGRLRRNGVILKRSKQYTLDKIQIGIGLIMASAFLDVEIDDPYHKRVMFKDRTLDNIFQLDNIYIEDTDSLPGEVWVPLVHYNNRKVRA